MEKFNQIKRNKIKMDCNASQNKHRKRIKIQRKSALYRVFDERIKSAMHTDENI